MRGLLVWLRQVSLEIIILLFAAEEQFGPKGSRCHENRATYPERLSDHMTEVLTHSGQDEDWRGVGTGLSNQDLIQFTSSGLEACQVRLVGINWRVAGVSGDLTAGSRCRWIKVLCFDG